MPQTRLVAQLAVNALLIVEVVMNLPPKQRAVDVPMFVATLVPVQAEMVPLDTLPPTPIHTTLPAVVVVTVGVDPVAALMLSVCTAVAKSSCTGLAAPANSHAHTPWPVAEVPGVQVTEVAPAGAIQYPIQTEPTLPLNSALVAWIVRACAPQTALGVFVLLCEKQLTIRLPEVVALRVTALLLPLPAVCAA
jgi:hypothetical protein